MMFYILLFLILFIMFKVNVTSVTFLFSILTLLLYVIPYIFLWEKFITLKFVSTKYLQSFSLLILLCYFFYVVGDNLRSFRIVKKYYSFSNDKSILNNYHLSINQVKYENYSIIAGIIGFIGYSLFILNSGVNLYLQGHGQGDYSIGGYIYELRYFIFSAVLLLYNFYLRKILTKKGLLFLFVFCFLLIIDAYFQQQRGSWIRLGIIFFLSFLFSQKNNLKLSLTTLISKYKIIFFAGLFIGVLLIFTVQIRNFYSPSKPFTDQIIETSTFIWNNADILIGGSGINEGNEFVTAFNGFQAAEISQTYDYGYKWLYPFMNFVPRKLWKNKPEWETFSTSLFTHIDKYSLITHAGGSVETGVVDSFYRFSWFAPFFFLIIGYSIKKLQVMSSFDLRYRLFYICLFIGFFYFFTQNMLPCIIFTLYMYLPILFITSSCIKVVKKPSIE